MRKSILIAVLVVLGLGLLLTGCSKWFTPPGETGPPPDSSSGAIVINEFEQKPPGDICSEEVQEWVELYNPTEEMVRLRGWQLTTCQEPSLKLDIPSALLRPGNYLTVEVSVKKMPLGARGNGCKDWLANEDECVILLGPDGNEVDRTAKLSDKENDDQSWQRCPDGQDTDSKDDWQFRPATKRASNNC